MKNNSKVASFIVIVIVVIIAGIGIYFAKSKTSEEPAEQTDTSITQKETDIILFYGSTCPHCKTVDEFIKANKITSYLKFQKLEVYNDKNNQKTMQEKQNLCKDLSEDDKGGVPFLYSSEKCVVGSTPIIEFFKEKAGI